ncbi:hypothetical protein BDC45DRAFT_268464 [Circinella umbellata]|nr:hypothetical protein BDC45DRAFT_268464 [Circinella umbellata]
MHSIIAFFFLTPFIVIIINTIFIKYAKSSFYIIFMFILVIHFASSSFQKRLFLYFSLFYCY